MSITKRINNGLAAFVLAAATVTSSIILPQTASAFAGGDGTSGNPYQIANCAQLDGMDDNDTDLDKHFMLVDDIDCQSVAMPPIGVTMAGAVKFTGVFDGNDKTISNVALNTFSQGTGLFWATDGATITDLTIDNITAEGEDNVGALAGQTEGGAIENVHVTSGSVSSSTDWGDNFGGLVGYADETAFTRVTANVTVDAISYYVGGLVGYTEWLEINQSGAYGDVTGMENVGGLVGFAGEDTHIIASHAKGDIHTEDVEGGARYLGGLIGHGDYAVIKNSYATGSVEGYNGVGGLAGYTYSSLIERSYATGAVSDISGSWGYSIGGLAGEIEGTDVHSAYSAGLVSGTSNDDIGGFIGRIKWSGNSVINGGWWTGSHSTAIGQDDSGSADPYFEVSSPDDFKNINHEIYTTSSEAHGYWQFEDDDYNGPAIWGMTSSVNTGFPCHVWEPDCGEESESSASDNDGVAAEIEHAAPNGGDGNADGTPDREQNNVASLVSPVSGKYVTVEAAGAGCALASVSIASESSHAAQDAGYDYQTGFVNFTATCGQTNVKIYYHGVVPGSLTVRKYNPTANSYFTIEAATIAAAPAPLSGTLVSYTIVDNDGLLDINPADGVITDPVALGGLVVNSPNTGLKRTTPQP